MTSRLIPMLVFMVILAIAVSILINIGSYLLARDPEAPGLFTPPEDHMRAYVSRMFPQLVDVRIDCAKWDTDGNGYVRCSAVGDDPLGSYVTLDRECPSLTSILASTCVVPKARGVLR